MLIRILVGMVAAVVVIIWGARVAMSYQGPTRVITVLFLVLLSATLLFGVRYGVSFIGSLARAREIDRLVHSSINLTLLWDSVAWLRIGIPDPSAMARIVSGPSTTAGLTADTGGLTFWVGVRNPERTRFIPWSEVGRISEKAIYSEPRTHPYLEIALIQDEPIVVEVESQGPWRAVAGLGELRKIVRSLDEVRSRAASVEVARQTS